MNGELDMDIPEVALAVDEAIRVSDEELDAEIGCHCADCRYWNTDEVE